MRGWLWVVVSVCLLGACDRSDDPGRFGIGGGARGPDHIGRSDRGDPPRQTVGRIPFGPVKDEEGERPVDMGAAAMIEGLAKGLSVGERDRRRIGRKGRLSAHRAVRKRRARHPR